MRRIDSMLRNKEINKARGKIYREHDKRLTALRKKIDRDVSGGYTVQILLLSIVVVAMIITILWMVLCGK